MPDLICGAYSLFGGSYSSCQQVLWGKRANSPIGTGCSSVSNISPDSNDAALPDVSAPDSAQVEVSLPDSEKEVQSGSCDDGNPSVSPQINWLKKQIGQAGLIDSYMDDGTDSAYLYDQAVAAIAFTQAGQICTAQQLFSSLNKLQKTNGSWNTCYSAENGLACESYVTTGSIAWMVMAINFYEAKTGDLQFHSMADKALGWMEGMRLTSGETRGALKYGEDENVISSEHNFDAYSAYYYHGQQEKAAQIKNYLIREMWAPSPDSNGPYHDVGVFWVGFGDFAWCTDPQSWGVLALGSNYTNSLEWLDSNGYGEGSTKNSKQGIEGFSFCTDDVNPPNDTIPSFCGSLFVWLEGTEGVAAAYYATGNSEKGDYYHSQTAKTIFSDGGIPYSIADTGDPVEWPCNWPYGAVASTAWYYFNEVKLNPFRPFITTSL